LIKKDIIDAIHNHFSYEVDLQIKKIKQIFKQGRFALMVGLGVLLLSVSLAANLEKFFEIPMLSAVKEGLVILGWVALWRPFDVFLYSWWPEIAKRKYFEKLSKIAIEIKDIKT
jgi:hypothetical protein